MIAYDDDIRGPHVKYIYNIIKCLLSSLLCTQIYLTPHEHMNDNDVDDDDKGK